MPLVNAVLSGEVNRLPGELRRMREVSLNPVGVLLAFERRAAQLAQLAARLGPGGRVNDLLDAEQKAHRVFLRDRRDLAVQLAALERGPSSSGWCSGSPTCTARCWPTARPPSCCSRKSWRRSPARRPRPPLTRRVLPFTRRASIWRRCRKPASTRCPTAGGSPSATSRGAGPTVVFLPGYMSDMAGGKATALFDWAEAQGRACLLLDYSGCGESPGDFAEGTLEPLAARKPPR